MGGIVKLKSIVIVAASLSLVAHVLSWADSTSFKLGVENGDHGWWQNQDLKVGLVTNQTGITQSGERTIDVLVSKGMQVKKIFAPEHGIQGTVAAGTKVEDEIDEKTKLPVISLYGHGSGKHIGGHLLHDIDALVFDMQDSGMRHFTYISTLLHVMESAATHNKKMVVFDRPNLLGGIIEGPLTRADHRSFIAAAPIPLRYGMTIGELAQFFNNHVLTTKVELTIVPMVLYDRHTSSYAYAPLSPFIKSQQACHGYSFLGLLGEVRPFDTGLGTELALRVVALPTESTMTAAQWRGIAQELKKLGIHGKSVTYFSPRKKKQCYGLEIALPDPSKAQSFKALLTILKTAHDAHVPLKFSEQFEVAVGTHKVHDYVRGSLPYEQLAQEVNDKLRAFVEKAQDSFLYQPAPTVQYL